MPATSALGKLGLLRPIIGISLGALVALGLAAPIQATETQSSAELIDSLVVKYEPGVAVKDASGNPTGEAALNTDVDLQVGEKIGLGYRTIEFDQPIPVEEAKRIAAQLDDSASVAVAEPNYVFTTGETFNQPINTAIDNWGLDRIDQVNVASDSKYQYSSSGVGVTAYVVDTGIRSDHAEFITNGVRRVLSGWTAYADGIGTEDCLGHGTHVAGIIGGNLFGVAKNVNLVPVRVLNCSGSGTTSELLDAIAWIISNHQAGTPAVANFSLGPSSPTGRIQSIDDAMGALAADGVQPFVASGNGINGVGQDACDYSPANSPATYTVSASNSVDSRASFSNYGDCTSIYAPGVNILSAGIASSTSSALKSGTSMATPFVAGVAANILQENSSFTVTQLLSKLDTTANDKINSGISLDTKKLLYQPVNGWGSGLNTSPATAFGTANNYLDSDTVVATRTATISPGNQTISGSSGSAITPTQFLTYENFAKYPGYSVSPALPDGLTLNSLTGVISGTPTFGVAGDVFTITASASNKTATSTVTINLSGTTKAQYEEAENAKRIATEQAAAFAQTQNTLSASAKKRVVTVTVTAPAGSTTNLQLQTSVRVKVAYQKAYKAREKYQVVNSLGKTVTKYRSVTKYKTAYKYQTQKIWKTVYNVATTASYSQKVKKSGYYRAQVVTPFGTTESKTFRVR